MIPFKVAAVYGDAADDVTGDSRRFRTIGVAGMMISGSARERSTGQGMATRLYARPRVLPDARFYLIGALLMMAVLVLGFSMQLAAGRSSFAAPPLVHVHGVLFFGWAVFYVLQTALASTGSLATHRRLGWFAAVWAPSMVVMGIWVTVAMVRRGAVPFVFAPAYFLVMNPLNILTFAALTAAGIRLRRQTQYHRRLLFCAMASLTGPGIGRLLPMPLLIPYAAWAVFVVVMLFPLAGAIRDIRTSGRVHPAWWWGMGSIAGAQIAMSLIAYGPVGAALYDFVTLGSPGADVPPLAYPPMPPM